MDPTNIVETSGVELSANVGLRAPEFVLKTEQGKEWRLSEHIGNVVVLLFYPQNETLVCTKQLCSVRDNWEKYIETKAEIVGISPGTPEEHQTFSNSRQLPLPLLADPGREITGIYGKHWLFPVNLTRAVVVIDANGVIRNRDVMLRAFRPSDSQVITDIYAARGDALHDKYAKLKRRVEKTS
ncbi:MAG: peroxiredoxin family protein [Pyrinomonadaceae bacterium]|nr:peroxiredoxin [Chloracidobacterium sp.]MBP7416135.1 peroxiredoxin [Pyrinomonadaceae bacterium]